MDGSWGLPAEVTVIIEGEISPTPEDTPTHTPTVEISRTPTITPTPDDQLALVNPTKSVNQFFYGGCAPDSVTFTIQATQPEKVKYMYLFYKLQDKDTGEMTESNGGTAMTKQGANTWTITLKSNQVQDYKKFDSAWVVYQFISQDANQELTRSKQLRDVMLSVCGSSILEPEKVPTIDIGSVWE